MAWERGYKTTCKAADLDHLTDLLGNIWKSF